MEKAVSEIALTLTTNQNLVLIPDIISLKPSLDMQIYFPFDSEFREVEGKLEGIWTLGTPERNTKFKTEFYYPGFDFYAGMAEGEQLYPDEVIKAILPSVELPKSEIKLTTMEVRGNALGLATVTLSELLPPSTGKIIWPGVSLESGQHGDDSLSVVEVPWKLLKNIMPDGEDLPFLAHVRRTRDERAVVICNRLPKLGSPSVVHLVSVEGRYKRENNKIVLEHQGVRDERPTSMRARYQEICNRHL
jgi:hypothetical protein